MSIVSLYITVLTLLVKTFINNINLPIRKIFRKFVLNFLERMVKDVASGRVQDFERYEPAHWGDKTLSMIVSQYASSKYVRVSCPSLKRKVYNYSENNVSSVGNCVLFVCGYASTFETYESFFNEFSCPIVAYQLPYTLINTNPDVVKEAFESTYEEICHDPMFEQFTHVIGNSIGTMIASRIAVEHAERHPTLTTLILVQTGSGYLPAVQRSKALFTKEMREELKDDDMYKKIERITSRYDPECLAPDMGKLSKRREFKLIIVQGMNDRVIVTADALLNPLIEKLERCDVKGYEIYKSERGGHNSAMLYFLWLIKHKGLCMKNSGHLAPE